MFVNISGLKIQFLVKLIGTSEVHNLLNIKMKFIMLYYVFRIIVGHNNRLTKCQEYFKIKETAASVCGGVKLMSMCDDANNKLQNNFIDYIIMLDKINYIQIISG